MLPDKMSGKKAVVSDSTPFRTGQWRDRPLIFRLASVSNYSQQIASSLLSG
jgi:hypothetical protein